MNLQETVWEQELRTSWLSQIESRIAQLTIQLEANPNEPDLARRLEIMQQALKRIDSL